MADPALNGNGEDCPACALRRAEDRWQARAHACNRCGGTGRLAWSREQIIALHVAEARIRHWPDFDARIAS